MKIILCSLLILFSAKQCLADEPPSWLPYKVTSANGKYFCWIDFSDKDTLEHAWDRKWKLSIYSNDSTLLWHRPFQPTGYPQGLLTNNGHNFIMIDWWYDEKLTVISVHKKNGKNIFIPGKSFHISPLFLVQTSSHQLWLEDYKITDKEIKLTTLDQSKWKIDIENGEISGSKSNLFLLLISAFAVVAILVLSLYLLKKRRS